MIIAGPCSWVNMDQETEIIETAKSLLNHADYFRCKLWLGGTTHEKYFTGIEEDGLYTLGIINDFIPTGTEVQTPEHVYLCRNLSFVWVGARNCQNYALLKSLEDFPGEVMIKRSPGITIDETIGIYDIMKHRHGKEVYIIERGINTFDRLADSRWTPDVKGAMRIRQERPDIWERYIIDCSHSVGRLYMIRPLYDVFKAMGTQGFMFEVMNNPDQSLTDKTQILTTEEFKEITCR